MLAIEEKVEDLVLGQAMFFVELSKQLIEEWTAQAKVVDLVCSISDDQIADRVIQTSYDSWRYKGLGIHCYKV